MARFFRTKRDQERRARHFTRGSIWADAAECADQAARRVASGDIDWPEVRSREERALVEAALAWARLGDGDDMEFEKVMDDLMFAAEGVLEARQREIASAPAVHMPEREQP